MKYLFVYLVALNLSASISFSQWMPQNSNSTRRLLTVYFLDENLGWAGEMKEVF